MWHCWPHRHRTCIPPYKYDYFLVDFGLLISTCFHVKLFCFLFLNLSALTIYERILMNISIYINYRDIWIMKCFTLLIAIRKWYNVSLYQYDFFRSDIILEKYIVLTQIILIVKKTSHTNDNYKRIQKLPM